MEYEETIEPMNNIICLDAKLLDKEGNEVSLSTLLTNKKAQTEGSAKYWRDVQFLPREFDFSEMLKSGDSYRKFKLWGLKNEEGKGYLLAYRPIIKEENYSIFPIRQPFECQPFKQTNLNFASVDGSYVEAHVEIIIPKREISENPIICLSQECFRSSGIAHDHCLSSIGFNDYEQKKLAPLVKSFVKKYGPQNTEAFIQPYDPGKTGHFYDYTHWLTASFGRRTELDFEWLRNGDVLVNAHPYHYSQDGPSNFVLDLISFKADADARRTGLEKTIENTQKLIEKAKL